MAERGAVVSYTITIRSEGFRNLGGNSPGTAATNTGAVTSSYSGSSDTSLKSRTVAAVGFAEQAGFLIWHNHINRIEIRTGHATQQQRINYAYSLSKQAFDIGKSIVFGAIWGGAAGAVLGGAMSVAGSVGSYVAANNTMNLERQVENIGLREAYIRAGAGGDRLGRNLL